jgi:hypothetical protein
MRTALAGQDAALPKLAWVDIADGGKQGLIKWNSAARVLPADLR